jgi:GMP synthase (glutamine-hydrolysing)
MRKDILILKNIHRENPGLLEDILKEYNFRYDIIDLDQTTIIQCIDRYGAFIVLGGPDSANDLNLKMQNELALIRKVVYANIPYLGICLGLQVLVKAMGGQVVKCHTKDVGFRDQNGEFFSVKLTQEGQTDDLFNNLPNAFAVFQLHGETVQITPQMTLLATGNLCQNQIVRIGPNAYGFQSHFELTKDMLETWIIEDPDLQKLDSKQIRSDFESIKDNYKQIGRQLFQNFLNIAGFL